MRIFFGLFTVAAMVALLAWALTRPAGQSGSSALLGKQARDFKVVLLSGGENLGSHVSLADFKGRPLIINFWASWCSSCRSEAQALERFSQENKEKVTVLGIAVQDSADAVREVIKTQGKTFPVAIDEDGSASVEYGVTGVPETFFIDAAGVVRYKATGPLEVHELAKKLELLTTAGDKGTH
jgi:cytochrome c biogenesis protein CcmG/thiol:disulfide interchange protein DsbE